MEKTVWSLNRMRKTKDIKRKRLSAGAEYKKGHRKDAYKMWDEAKKEMDELKGRNKPAVEEHATAPAEAPAQ
jgi:Zn ribbon nucleic-acid-binding protein